MTDVETPTTKMTQNIGRGFENSVDASQEVFRAVMDAMARPGTHHRLPTSLLPPPGLPKSLAALALALADFETPIWLDNSLAEQFAIVRYLKLFTGAPLVSDPGGAAFALVSDVAAMPRTAEFAQGTLAYPDRSTTIFVHVEALDGGSPMKLRGPGIKGTISFAPRPQPPGLVAQLATNRAQFPCGVDLIFASPDGIAALPRSLHVSAED